MRIIMWMQSIGLFILYTKFIHQINTMRVCVINLEGINKFGYASHYAKCAIDEATKRYIIITRHVHIYIGSHLAYFMLNLYNVKFALL